MRSEEQVLIAITRADGGVSVMAFATVERDALGRVIRERIPIDSAVEAEIDLWTTSLDAESRAAWTPIQRWRIVTRDAIPADREFRAALIDHPDLGFLYDVDTAKTIALDRVRADRDVALAELDVQWMRAVGQKDTLTADLVEAQRQTLRDQPQVLIDALKGVSTIADLKTAVAANHTATASSVEALAPTPGVSGSGSVIR